MILLAAGCHKKAKAPMESTAPELPPAPVPTATMSATPPMVDKGDAVVLVWRTTDATDVSIDGIGPVKPNSQMMVQPTVTTNYHLIAKGDGGIAEANVNVTVNGAAAPTPPPAASSSTESSMTDDQMFHQNVQDVFFDYDSFDVRADATPVLQQDAAWLAAHPNVKIVIGGYCDDRGSTEYNIALGENRANAAKTALIKDGVAASRIRTISYGKEKQFCTEDTESCWQQNRRAGFSMDK
jgi:peptidoglycan-associated lipoprotein